MCVGTNTCQLKANKHKSKNAWNRFVRSWDSETRQHIWTMLIYDFYVMHVYKRCWHEECRQHSTFNQTCVTQLVFAVQPFESFEALLMPVLWHHDCINLDAHTIPLAKTVGRSVCYSVARKSGHVGKIFTSKKNTIYHHIYNLKFIRISGDHFFVGAPFMLHDVEIWHM